ncbi:RING zinc finger-containing protein [Tieghemostelium lacteum]|uniref:RING zinc finger-containing protein n=1 Tax=Tieghemostelium lacteum TaxID=361077 RepID=A0A151ZFX3_TIELA|nr:RING zinc finger-containing protein [Tieghemostelium lacteum]|eukprot:KYQ92868.1 RING zinc finger-containing protein [Tieghemostelium lacteum]
MSHVIEKCSAEKHLSLAEQYCKQCNQLVCKQCNSEHQHSLMNYYQVIQEIAQDSAGLNDKLNLWREDKKVHDELFKIQVQDKYDSQLELVSKHFRDLHDILHFKEVELKRELKSYQDENLELYTTIVSQLEHEIQSSTEFLHEFKDVSQVDHDPVSSNNNQQNSDEVKSQVLEKYYKFKKNTNGDDNCKNQDYQVVSLNESLIINVSNTIGTMELKKRFRNIINKNNNDTIIYRYSSKGVERININHDETTLIVGNEAVGQPPSNNNGYLYQNNSADGMLILFGSRKYYMLDTKEKNPVWVTGDWTTNREKTWYQPTIYDGKQYVYIVGGANNGDEANFKAGRDIYKFHVSTQTFESVGELPVTSRFHSLSIDGDFVYVFGQNNSKESYMNRIDRFNVNTGIVEPIYKATEAQIKGGFGVVTGCFDTQTKYCYCMGQQFTFFRYDPSDKSSKVLQPFPIAATDKRPLLHCKIHLDQPKGLIYFYYLQDSSSTTDSISVYNIKENQWTKISNVFQTKAGWLDYFSFSGL